MTDIWNDEQMVGTEETINTKTQVMMSEALRRINQAKLYESLINHEFFEIGSAEPDMIAIVQSEIREFIITRLEILLGIKSDMSRANVTVQSPFLPEEIDVLKSLAQRALNSQPKVFNPTVIPVKSNTLPVITPVSPQPIKSRQDNIAVDTEGKRVYKKQTVSKKTPPLPMPSVEAMNMRAASDAAANLQSATNNLGGNNAVATGMSALIQNLVGAASMANGEVDK